MQVGPYEYPVVNAGHKQINKRVSKPVFRTARRSLIRTIDNSKSIDETYDLKSRQNSLETERQPHLLLNPIDTS